MKIIFTFLREMLVVSKYLTTFAPQLRKYIFPDLVAQMAESVDALVSNTSGVTSIPVRPRVWVQINPDNRLIIRVFSFCKAY